MASCSACPALAFCSACPTLASCPVGPVLASCSACPALAPLSAYSSRPSSTPRAWPTVPTPDPRWRSFAFSVYTLYYIFIRTYSVSFCIWKFIFVPIFWCRMTLWCFWCMAFWIKSLFLLLWKLLSQKLQCWLSNHFTRTIISIVSQSQHQSDGLPFLHQWKRAEFFHCISQHLVLFQ